MEEAGGQQEGASEDGEAGGWGKGSQKKQYKMVSMYNSARMNMLLCTLT